MHNEFTSILNNCPSWSKTILFILGAIIGSFLNVVIYRLPIIQEANLNLIYPRSHCPQCKKNIPIWANIPIISYLLLKGKCFKCNTSISVRYPLVEILTAIMFVVSSSIFSGILPLIGALIFISVSICLIFIDYNTFTLPDELTLLLLWVGLIFNLSGTFSGSLENSVLGAIAGYILLWSIFWIFKLLTKMDGMGYGDFKFLSAILAWLGYNSLAPVTFIASIFGITYFIVLSIYLRFKNKTTLHGLIHRQIPFGPFLGTAGIIVILTNKHFISLF